MKNSPDPKPEALPLPWTAIEERQQKSNYPPLYARRMVGRTKRRLGDAFGLQRFGVNHTTLLPGAQSALQHFHSSQDEFLFILQGHPTLVLGDQEFVMAPGDCIGFAAGVPLGHRLINRSDSAVVYLEVGDRAAGDQVAYPDDDLQARLNEQGKWEFVRKDGSPISDELES